MKSTKNFFGLISIMLIIGFVFLGCQNELAESTSVKTEHSVYAMVSTFIPKPTETTNFGEDEYNSHC
jgi:hypothetical protein